MAMADTATMATTVTMAITAVRIRNKEDSIMENKELRNSLITIMKEEIAQLANEQKEQKKTRKLANRPKEKSLQDIVDEINNRAYKIYNLLYYYRWIRHGLQYWSNRGINSFKEFKFLKLEDKGFDSEDYYYKNWDKVIDWGTNKGKTHGEVLIQHAKNYYINKCNEYGIEVTEANVNYLIQNV